MTPEEMLTALGAVGTKSGSEFNDDLGGWFYWNFRTVDGVANRDRGMLTIRFIPAETDEAGVPVTRRFWVVPA